MARATGWNVGIHSIDASGDIEVSIKRSGYEILTNAVCEVTVEAEGGWSTSIVVDITYPELLARPIGIDNPGGLTKDERITASIACSLPFDLDDNPDDDSMSDFYETESLLAVSSSDVGWIVGVGAFIVALAWLIGFIQPQQTRKSDVKSASTTKKQPADTELKSEEVNVEVEEDDFNLQIDEVDVPETNEESTEETSGETIESTTIEVIERIEEAVEEEPTASGRLASLREEMGTDSGVEREGSLEDRMSKFFGDDR